MSLGAGGGRARSLGAAQRPTGAYAPRSDRCPGLSLLALEQPLPFDVLPPGGVLPHSPQVSHLCGLNLCERIRLPRCGRRGFRLFLLRWPDLFALSFADRIIGLHFSCGLPLCLTRLRLESQRRPAMLSNRATG
jgi:hypothetical protein